MISSPVMTAAAGEAGDPAPGWTDALVALMTGRTPELVAAADSPTFKRKLVSAFLARNSKIPTCFPPFNTMGGNPAATMTVMGHEMRQFMQEGVGDLLFRDRFEPRIEPDLAAGGDGHPGSRSHPGIPPDADFSREFRGNRHEKFSGLIFKSLITAAMGAGGGRRFFRCLRRNCYDTGKKKFYL